MTPVQTAEITSREIIPPYDVGSWHALTADAPGHKQPLHFWRSAELDCHFQDIESISSLDLAIFGDSYRNAGVCRIWFRTTQEGKTDFNGVATVHLSRQ